MNSNFTFYELLNDPNWKRFEPYISLNPNITWQIVQENHLIDWNFSALFHNSNITWEIVQENSYLDWGYDESRVNLNISTAEISSPTLSLKVMIK